MYARDMAATRRIATTDLRVWPFSRNRGNTKSKARECHLGGRSGTRFGRIGHRRARGICAECFHLGTGMQPSSTPASLTIGRGRWHRLPLIAQSRLGVSVRQQMAKRADGGGTPDPAFGDEPAVPSLEVVLIEQAAQRFSREKTDFFIVSPYLSKLQVFSLFQRTGLTMLATLVKAIAKKQIGTLKKCRHRLFSRGTAGGRDGRVQ
jgi:hypothetical protein